MHHGRWYPYCITLDDGKVLTIGGLMNGAVITHLLRYMTQIQNRGASNMIQQLAILTA